MRINISSKTLSVIISAFVFSAIGILSVALIDKGNLSDFDALDVSGREEYSEHEGWTDVSEMIDVDFSNESIQETFQDKINNVNGKYQCGSTLTDKQFSDEIGIKISELSFLRDYSPDVVRYSYGYIYAGDKVFDSRGNDITQFVHGYTLIEARDKNGRALFEKDGNYYYLQNNTMLQTEDSTKIYKGPSYVTDFDTDLMLFKTGDKWGAQDSGGKIIVKALYTHAYGFKERLFCFASKSNTLYIYNDKGVLISSKYFLPQNETGSKLFQDGIMLVTDGKKNLILKSNGAILDIPDDFKITGCSDGVVLVEKNGSKGFIDNTGKWIYNPNLTKASFFSEGLAVVSDGEVFVIDKKGNEIIPTCFDYISDFSDGIAIMYSNEHGWYIAQKFDLK